MVDVYTAGHQKNVSDLACKIAKQLGLKEDIIEGIRVAGLLHDIGKIYMPASILSKPSNLSKNEFDLIREHPEIGYKIIKNIDFPCPVADIILQHHERLNGSGYPCRLVEEEICIEAKIIAVADVIEAMSSHRPYRPALSLEDAIKEIEKNKGILYDTKVAEACVEVLRNECL